MINININIFSVDILNFTLYDWKKIMKLETWNASSSTILQTLMFIAFNLLHNVAETIRQSLIQLKSIISIYTLQFLMRYSVVVSDSQKKTVLN